LGERRRIEFQAIERWVGSEPRLAPYRRTVRIQTLGGPIRVSGSSMKNKRAVAVRRLLAFAVDWLVVVVWGGVLFGAVMIATGGNPPRLENSWKAQAIGLLTMTVPVTLYFAFCESSALRASLGKRVLGLVVCRETGERLLFGSALLRNAVKFVPWEFGHTVAQQAVFSGEGGVPAWVWGPATVALVGPLWWLVAMIATGRTPYDRWVSARVARSAVHEPRFELPPLVARQDAAADARPQAGERG
jgi:uncharacterized RDD family membrane protein YckC